MKTLVSVALAMFLLGSMISCGGEQEELAGEEFAGEEEVVEEELEPYSYVSPMQFRNVAVNKCIKSNPLGMAACTSATPKIETRIVSVTYHNRTVRLFGNLRFVGTNQCLRNHSDGRVTMATCEKNHKRFRWYLGSSKGKSIFASSKDGKCLKVNSSGVLKSGSCKENKYRWELISI